MRKPTLAYVWAGALALSLSTLTPALATAATPSGPQHSARADAGVLVWCTNSRPQPGSIPYGPNFAGISGTQACQKCEEYMIRERAQGRITAWACEYNASLGYAHGYANVARTHTPT
ncbi:hypothetical protein [Streptomyces tauricus]|uniref:hypothetical protein n=1 Tax=Streptomyces tauricus TaxID=68274 RepID=UPI003427291E